MDRLQRLFQGLPMGGGGGAGPDGPVGDTAEKVTISSLALLVTRDGKAEMLTEPSCNARQHLAALKRLGDCRGGASLQNVLELARQALESMASFVSREVLLLSASLSTCDPGDIHETIASLKRQRVRCSVCSL